MSFSAYLRGLFVAALAVMIAAPASADIKAFNAAVRSGDYKTAATEAETIWKTWNLADDQTALMAREFGFVALVSGRNDLALQFGQFLADKGPTLTKPDDQPWTSAVLHRVAAYKVKPGTPERQALREALQARSALPGVDMTTVLAWEVLHVADWNAGDWANVEIDATAAAEFFGRQPKGLLHRQRAAEVNAAAASFLSGRSRVTKGRNDYYDRMATVHNAIVADIDAASTPGDRNLLWSLKWKSEAWTLSMWSFLSSTYEQTGSLISTEVKERQLAQPKLAQYAESNDAAALPVCDGEFTGRKLTYPASQSFKGTVGAVLARMETGRDGKVTKVELLAAVPADAFGGGVVETLKTWYYKPAKDANLLACRLNSLNHVYQVIFLVG